MNCESSVDWATSSIWMKGLPDQSVCRALDELKKRWKKKPHERDTIRHLVAALFPDNHDKMMTWLEQA